MTTLAENKTENKKIITLEQIDEYDSIVHYETGALSQVNGSNKITENSRMAEVHGVEIRNAMRALREQIVLYEFYKARLG